MNRRASSFSSGVASPDSSFFMRHIRGIVGLTLFVILILMFVFYAFTNAGQRSPARGGYAPIDIGGARRSWRVALSRY